MDTTDSSTDMMEDDVVTAAALKHSTTSVVQQRAQHSSDALELSGRDGHEAASVNVFVLENKQSDARRDGGNSPLVIHDQPSVPQTDRDTTREYEMSGPVRAVSFQSAVSQARPDVDVTSGGIKDELSRQSATTAASDVTQTGDASVVRGDVEDQRLRADSVNRAVLELDGGTICEFYTSWFQLPWLAYLTVVVVATMLSLCTQTDAALLVVVVVVATATCFCLFPLHDNEVKGERS